jgi:hypothetical protein
LSEWLAYLSRVFLQQELHEVGHLLLQLPRPVDESTSPVAAFSSPARLFSCVAL